MDIRIGEMRRLVWAAALLAVVFCAGYMRTDAASKVELNREQVTAYPGMESVRLRVKNISPTKTVKWRSGDEKIVSVDEKGRLTFLKQGNTIVRAKVGARSYRCIVSVCSKKAYKAVEIATNFYKARNMHYSQGNRMGRRSADCSAFCGRCYLPMGLTMGGSTRWCNTAAGMAKWASKNHKVVSNGAVSMSSLRLQPGDLVFYRKGHNGRYKNIYHVEIFTGYGFKGSRIVGYTMSSIIGHYPSILKRDYASRQRRIAEISRPTK